ncbi:phytanoyl-CoA dioxygenase PhyH [Hyaloraphidium curvatum]|nr:phytanoyl-CoA dioxygenase PhyH [Hyaloraphidium curvatum]
MASVFAPEAPPQLPPPVPLSALPPQNWAEAARVLERDGVVCLRGALTKDGLARIEAACEHAFANPSPTANNLFGKEGSPEVFFEDKTNKMAPIARAAGIDTIVRALWGMGQHDEVRYMYEQLFKKEGGAVRRTPWHQDSPYLRTRGSQQVAIWISLDPLSAKHSLEFVRGSHKGILFNGSAFSPDDDTEPLYKDSELPRLPDIEANRAAYDIVAWDLQPGDLLIFHLSILHGGAGVDKGMRSRRVSLRFMGPDVVYDGRASQEDQGVVMDGYAGVKDGDPFPGRDMMARL